MIWGITKVSYCRLKIIGNCAAVCLPSRTFKTHLPCYPNFHIRRTKFRSPVLTIRCQIGLYFSRNLLLRTPFPHFKPVLGESRARHMLDRSVCRARPGCLPMSAGQTCSVKYADFGDFADLVTPRGTPPPGHPVTTRPLPPPGHPGATCPPPPGHPGAARPVHPLLLDTLERPAIPLLLDALEQPALPLLLDTLERPVLPLLLDALEQSAHPLLLATLELPALPLLLDALEQPALSLLLSTLDRPALPLSLGAALIGPTPRYRGLVDGERSRRRAARQQVNQFSTLSVPACVFLISISSFFSHKCFSMFLYVPIFSPMLSSPLLYTLLSSPIFSPMLS